MKKLVCLIAVLALTAPLYASTITLNASDAGSGQLKIGYASNDANAPVGISFKVDLGVNAEVQASTDVVSSLSSVFNANIDYANSAGAGYTALGQGHPLANPDANGVLAFPASTFAVCMGALLASPAVPPTSTDNLITLQLHALGGATSATATISADTAGRGGVQGAAAFTVVYPSPVVINLVSDCMKTSDAAYAYWSVNGKPNCMCYRKQCNGDASGTAVLGKWVTSVDLNMLKAAYNLTMAQVVALPGGTGLCADFSHSLVLGKPVTSVDLNILKTYYNQAVVPDCPMTNLNFYTN